MNNDCYLEFNLVQVLIQDLGRMNLHKGCLSFHHLKLVTIRYLLKDLVINDHFPSLFVLHYDQNQNQNHYDFGEGEIDQMNYSFNHAFNLHHQMVEHIPKY
jgi:hypothetical protein